MRVVSGLAQASVAVISGIVDTVGAVIDRIGPDDGTTPEDGTLRLLRTDTQLSDEPSADNASFALTAGDSTETDDDVPQAEFTDAEIETQGLDDESTETIESDETTEASGTEDESTGTEDETTETTGSQDETTGSEDEAEDEVTESNTSTTTQDDTTTTEPADPSRAENSEGANQTANSAAGEEKSRTARRRAHRKDVGTSDDVTLVPPMGFEPTLPP